MPPTDHHSNFRSRLEALRHGNKQAPISPPPAKAPNNQNMANSMQTKSEALRTRLSAQQASPAENSTPQSAAAPMPTAQPKLEQQNIPRPENTHTKEEQSVWNAEYGGTCPQCEYFNPGHVVFCQYCEYMLLRSNTADIQVITSYPLKQVKGLALTFVNKLAELKIHTTEDILRVATLSANRHKISQWTGLSERTLLKLVHTADLCRIPSIGPEYAFMLDFIAIPTLDELLKQSAEKIYAKIQQNKNKINQVGILILPTRKQISQWLEEAQRLPLIKI